MGEYSTYPLMQGSVKHDRSALPRYRLYTLCDGARMDGTNTEIVNPGAWRGARFNHVPLGQPLSLPKMAIAPVPTQHGQHSLAGIRPSV